MNKIIPTAQQIECPKCDVRMKVPSKGENFECPKCDNKRSVEIVSRETVFFTLIHNQLEKRGVKKLFVKTDSDGFEIHIEKLWEPSVLADIAYPFFLAKSLRFAEEESVDFYLERRGDAQLMRLSEDYSMSDVLLIINQYVGSIADVEGGLTLGDLTIKAIR